MTDLQAPPSRRGGPADGRVGDSPVRPDGTPKVQGRFAFSSDLQADGMLWGRTLRSPHPHARIAALDVGPALAIPGVACVVTADDVPGSATYGLISADQPVFARDVVRFVGEAVAAVAADHPDTARRALDAIAVTYEVLDPLVDPEAAPGAPPIHPEGNVIRRIVIEHGDAGPGTPPAPGVVVVEGAYDVGMQDQAFLGPESGLAVPDGSGGIDLWVATQWLHEDRDQVAACLGLTVDDVRLHLGGVGGAFGGREDVSMQVHACLLALAAGRPVKISYLRDESFLGHVHRHPARLRYRHHATPDGDLVKVEADLVLDGGAYASSSSAVIANAARFACGPYRVPNARIDATVVRTNNPPCGAMRGFGAVQVCFAHEAQMDRLAAELGIDPVDLRLRNALGPGDVLPTGQRITGTAPVAECIRAAVAHPLPPVAGDGLLERPGGAGRTDDPARTRRGVGVAVGFKNLLYSEGFDDTSEARVRLADGVATVSCAVAEVGQGFVTIAGQIARTVLGCSAAVVEPAGTASTGSAGSSSASRQTWMSGGAVLRACRLVADQVRAEVARRHGVAAEALVLDDEGRITSTDPGVEVDLTVAEAAGTAAYEATAVHRHRPTVPLDDRGQGDADVSYAFAAHRAVVDVDPDLGLVRVVQVATGQDVGRVLHPTQVIGQIEGGIAQGVGLAVMEEIVLEGGLVRNPSFTDYLIPTVADAPEVLATCIEQPEPGAPFGAKGVGEPPTISSTAAVVAAIRAATGVEVARVPVRPWDLV
ncbi:MAG TPA: xanthine dehydrogenase subunit D [Acidimicrobiales bacterium]|nr:xanthine dehydrogenase subunit D [Acidimicrobiales bacterium]